MKFNSIFFGILVFTSVITFSSQIFSVPFPDSVKTERYSIPTYVVPFPSLVSVRQMTEDELFRNMKKHSTNREDKSQVYDYK
ncbi:MAG: hypothetical protein JJV93_00295 [Alphaproteobacteria bacterium]|nr:hypothetical protein [Alphaproteobacteria bacterium]MBL0717694.1 hypothetical protein [Alphaproteobacteria bacterium]